MNLQTPPPLNPNSPFLLNHQDSSSSHDQISTDHDDHKKLDVVISAAVVPEETGRERLKRHRVAVAGQVWIPDKWGQEELLKDWIDGSVFEASFFPSEIGSARQALAREAKRSSSQNNNNVGAATAAAAAGALRILNSC